MAIQLNMIFAYGFGIILLYLLGRSFVMPMKYVVRVAVNTALGAVGLLVINYIGGNFGFHIAFNIITAVMTGFLGIPGVVLLVLLKGIFGV